MRGNAESKLSISGGKKYKNDDNDVAMKTNLTCKYLYEERFPSFSFCSFWFLGLREFLSSASQCVTVSVNSLQCLSVCQSRSPYISFPTCILILRFEVLMLFVYSLFFFFFSLHATFSATTFLPALSSPCSQTLNCSKSVCRSFPGVSLPLHMWTALVLLPLLNAALHAIFLPAADCLSWRGHLPLNSFKH